MQRCRGAFSEIRTFSERVTVTNCARSVRDMQYACSTPAHPQLLGTGAYRGWTRTDRPEPFEALEVLVPAHAPVRDLQSTSARASSRGAALGKRRSSAGAVP